MAALGGSIAVASDALLRGRSLSEGQPVATLALAYDDAGGPYAGAAVTGVLAGQGGARLLAVQEYGGYARRLRPGLTLDLGLANSDYPARGVAARALRYAEAHVGLIGRHLSGRISVSPDYFAPGATTVYGEAAALIGTPAHWHVDLHGGVLRWLRDRPAAGPATHYDWSVGLGRTIGRMDLRLVWAAGTPSRGFYAGDTPRRGTIMGSVGVAF